jgi:hypothetical protein
MGRLIIESKAACKGKEAMIGRDDKNIFSELIKKRDGYGSGFYGHCLLLHADLKLISVADSVAGSP